MGIYKDFQPDLESDQLDIDLDIHLDVCMILMDLSKDIHNRYPDIRKTLDISG
jgi:hypothetical protein